MKKTLFISSIAAVVIFVMTASSFAQAATLTRQLEVGSNGADVSSLQTFLSQDQALYPEALVTGYFGNLTKSAVTNFQLRNEIPSVGRVGPMTLPIINYQMVNGMYPGMGMVSGIYPVTYTGADISAPDIIGVNVNTTATSANVSWNTNELAKGVVYYSNIPLTFNEQSNSVTSSGFTAFTDTSTRISQNVQISGLQSNTVYYYSVYTTDQSGNVSITWPSTFRTN